MKIFIFLLTICMAFSAQTSCADIIASVSANGIHFDGSEYALRNEMAAAGQDFWGNQALNQSVAAAEFDLDGIEFGVHTLRLIDSGGGGTDNTLNLFGYLGNGIVETSDRLNTLDLLTVFQTEFAQGNGLPQYFIDVSPFVNQRIDKNEQYAGFLITPATSSTLEGFGFSAELESNSVPEPTGVSLLSLCAFGLLARRNRRQHSIRF